MILLPLLALAFLPPGAARATEPDPARDQAQAIKEEWAVIYFHAVESERAGRFEELLERAHGLRQRYPERAEPLAVEALVLCTYAADDLGFGTPRRMRKARRLLQSSLDIDPRALDGLAYLTLGNLYHRLPGRPFSYGDDEVAQQYFEAALALFPDAPDANYFYGEFLVDRGRFDMARVLLERALAAPVRADAKLSDLKLKEDARRALTRLRAEAADGAGLFDRLLAVFGGA